MSEGIFIIECYIDDGDGGTEFYMTYDTEFKTKEAAEEAAKGLIADNVFPRCVVLAFDAEWWEDMKSRNGRRE